MLKIILLLCIIPLSGHAQIDKKLDKEVEGALETLEVLKFIKSIEKIKSYKDPSEINEMEYEMKMFFNKIKFWFYFDPADYKASLKRNLRISFNRGEMKNIRQAIKNPFVVKVTKSLTLYRDVFGEYHNLILTKKVPEPVMDTRFVLIKNLFNTLGMSVQEELADKRISQLVNSGLVSVPMLGAPDDVAIINTTGLEARQKKLNRYLVLVLANHLKSYRHYEIREFIRLLSTDNLLRKFTQLLVNFHYLYLYNYMSKVEQDKLRQLKALQPSL